MPAGGATPDATAAVESSEGIGEALVVDCEHGPDLLARERLGTALERLQYALLQSGLPGGVIGYDFQMRCVLGELEQERVGGRC